jgi:dTDP-3-amino-3,4,6-trideoxy-alpha-D-glucopyranose N,N-dimethyltransferase
MFRTSAHVYDLIYGSLKDYASEANLLTQIIRARVPKAGTLLDVGCGTGRHLESLQRDFDVVGVDIDAGMLDVARRRLPNVELIQADMRDFSIGRRFEAVVCLFSSIGYMPERADLRSAIHSMANHLSDPGVLVVDGWVRPDEWQGADGQITLAMDCAQSDEAKVVRVSRNRREGHHTVLEMQYLVATQARIEHLTDTHRLTLFSDGEYRDAFGAAGLTVEVLPSPMPGRDRYVSMRDGPHAGGDS